MRNSSTGPTRRSSDVAAWLILVLMLGCGTEQPTTTGEVDTAPEQARETSAYVGSEACRTCHAEQYAAWQASQHDLAMQPANARTVLGDFDETGLEYAGISYRFSTRDGKFYAVADDSNGDIREFEISHTFGVYPLQQYLVPFPGGRRQALSVAWDTRPVDQGGQRWFHIYPDEAVTHGDELHWTGRNHNWNYMCADCHSTDLRKGYDLSSKQYDTKYAEINVGCEACHGPGSAHVLGAAGGDATGTVAALTSQPEQIDTCARCHSRRGILAEGFTPGGNFLDHYRPALLDEGLYHADGQILDEVYVYGSFLQSKMHQRGVRCTDCHNPHTAALERPGNETCTHCHQNAPPDRFSTLEAGLYDSPQHHFHETGTAGAQCVNCHMPAKNYMVVDPRRDHSFRVPRPDLSAALDTPDACNGCHEDRTPAWAVAEIRKRYPAEPPAHYGKTIAAGRRRDAGADAKLAQLAGDASAAGIVRATALSLLAGFDSEQAEDALAQGLNDTEPLIRLGALYGINETIIERRWKSAQHLLDDPILAVRAEAAVALAPAYAAGITQSDQQRLQSAVADYIAAQLVNADTPQALTNLGGIYATMGDDENAESAFRHAIDTDPSWVPALVNFADFYRARGRDAEGTALLRKAISAAPDSGDVRYAYGLMLVREGRSDEALAELERAVRLRPDNARYIYVYGVALNSEGRADDAIGVLENGLEKFPQDPDILFALTTIERDLGNVENALSYAKRLARQRPLDRNLQELIRQLSAASANR